ncbi:DnaJ domain-containing protein [Pedobacter sp. HMF7647]|uniref:DnaJ domain-containing protein n=1 Tax=Hufsiella arboris TaxID=2695275 RepID=A0A7K1YGU5_9SPHI|nr:iron-sulfur cluster co-chaperone HscB C-terminal domain-containing protein [Hufsiella arboris]MXV53279.1 DnaJ domain-containing protein [Hufsiella arboris]
MNYFEFYELPVTFNVDKAAVKKKFYELSKRYHPDFYVNESQDKQQEILELSTLNNKAYQVFSDAEKITHYVLQLNDLIAEGEKYQLPQEFLMDMMDINEQLMELEFDADPVAIAKATGEVDQFETAIVGEMSNLKQSFDTAGDADKKSILLKIKDLWYRKKYLLRIKDSLNRFASR